MRRNILGWAAALAIGSCAGGAGSTGTIRAELIDGTGKKIGSATFVQESGGVRITMEAASLTPGVHAMHLHTVGECHGPDFKSAGAHFNPFGKKHGLENPEGPHAGDLPNFEVGADGTAKVSVLAERVTLGEGAHSLFIPGGTCLVIHAGPDDHKADPAGNAGARVACGIIRNASE